MLTYVPPQPEPVPVPAESASVGASTRARTPWGFGWTSYDELRPPEQKRYSSIRLDRVSHECRSAPFRALSFDFDALLHSAAATHRIVVTTSGIVNAVVFWFDCTLLR